MTGDHQIVRVHTAELVRDTLGQRWLKIDSSMQVSWVLGDREDAVAVVDAALARLRTALLEFEGMGRDLTKEARN